MKYVLLVIGGLVLGAGGVALFSEVRAFSQVNDKQSAFENADGFAAQLRAQRLVRALGSGDGQQVRDGLADTLVSDPFDPVLLTLKAINLAQTDLAASARLLDQARAIAPRDPHIRALSLALQVRLQSLPPSALPPAE